MSFKKINDLPIDLGKIKEIFCGPYHTLILTIDNDIYSGGHNSKG